MIYGSAQLLRLPSSGISSTQATIAEGRGSEVSLITPKETAVVEANEGVYQYQILQTGIQRQKDGPSRAPNLSPTVTES
jgi:hypothetical protein